jgi:phage-related minor tail protein
MTDRIYRTQLVLDSRSMEAGSAAADRALARVSKTTDALAQHLQLAAQAGTRFEAQQQGMAAAQQRTTQLAQQQSAAFQSLAGAATGQARVTGAPDQLGGLQALANIRQAAQAQERREYQQHQSALDGIRAAAQAKQRADAQSQAQFLSGLERSASSIGKTRAELLTMEAAQRGVTAQAAPFIARIAQADRVTSGFARTGKLTAIELQQVSYQLNDLGVQLASGQSPLIAMIQQGSQLSGTFGGVRPALAALGSLISPAVVGFGALAAGTVALAVAWAKGDSESRAFRNSLILTGNAAGITRDGFSSMAVTVAQASSVSIGAAREIGAALVATGKVGPLAIGAIATAAATLQRVSGQSSEEVIKDFAAMSQGVARWAAEHNRSYNYLTVEQYKYIRSLEAQGKVEEAMRANAQLFDDALKKRAQQLGLLERAWKGVKEAASGAGNAMFAIGRPETAGDQAQTLLANLALQRERLEQAERRGTSEEGGPGEPGLRRRREVIALMENQLETLRKLQQGESAAAAQSAETARENQRDIAREQASYQGTVLAQQKAGFSLQAAQSEVAREQERAALERSYDDGLLSLQGYTQARYYLELQGLAAKRDAIDQEIALERRRPLGEGDAIAMEQARNQQAARITELQAQRTRIAAEQVKLDEQLRRGEMKPREKPRNEDPLGSFIDDQINRQIERDERRVAAGQRFADDLRVRAQELNVSLITDDRARGQAQLAIERAQISSRIEALELFDDDRRAAQDALGDYILAREAQLTESLKPEWQRRLEAWDDVERRRREVSDEINTQFVDGGREMFAQWFETGRLSFDSLKRYALRTLGEQFYERMGYGQALKQAGDVLFSAINTALPGQIDAGVPAARSAEYDLFRRMEAAYDPLAEAIGDTTAATVQSTVKTLAEATATAAATGSVVGLTQAASAAAAVLSTIGATGGGGGGGFLGSLFSGIDLGGGFSLPSFGEGLNLPPLPGFGGLFAKGGAFGRSGQMAVQRFAKGGAFTNHIVDRPTEFSYAGGRRRGLMGEAGPEAVLPLERGPGGRLGVRAVGGGGQAASAPVNFKLEIINNGTPQREVGRQMDGDTMRVFVEDVVAESIDSGGKVARAGQRTWGLSRAGGLARRG